jgi:hypothetical protein
LDEKLKIGVMFLISTTVPLLFFPTMLLKRNGTAKGWLGLCKRCSEEISEQVLWKLEAVNCELLSHRVKSFSCCAPST